MNTPFNTEDPYIVGFYVLDKLLSIYRTPFVAIVDPQKRIDAKVAREMFCIPSNKQLFIYSGVPSGPITEDDILYPLFNVELYRLTPSGVVYDQNWVVIESISEVTVLRDVVSAIDAAKILCLLKFYQELPICPFQNFDKIMSILNFYEKTDRNSYQYAIEMFDII